MSYAYTMAANYTPVTKSVIPIILSNTVIQMIKLNYIINYLEWPK